MNRIVACVVASAAVGYACAQAPFTIVRPSDGSKVRETVHVLFPKGSVPASGYVGIYVNGKFIEACVPNPTAKFLDYSLDTKRLGLQDGPLTIEAVLFMNFAEKPRIMDRSSVQVTLANQANITIPENGYTLRYHFQPNQELVYNWDVTMTTSSITEGQAKLGGHAAELPIEDFHGRMVYGIDNTYGDGDALVRMQPLPPAGKNSMLLALPDSPTPRPVTAQMFYPVYMRIHNTGAEVFGLIPQFFGISGGTAGYSGTDILATEPLPTLPIKAVKPGDTWFGRFQLAHAGDQSGQVDLALVAQRDSIVEKIPARGELVDVEWEMGHPCAKVHDSYEVGQGGPGEGANNLKSNAQSVDETFWFALDKKQVVKLVRTITIDHKIENGPAQGAMGGPGMGEGMPGRFGAGMPGAGGAAPGKGRGGAADQMPNGPPGGPGRRFGQGYMGPRGLGAGVAPGMPGGTMPGEAPNETPQNELTRITMTQVFTLIH